MAKRLSEIMKPLYYEPIIIEKQRGRVSVTFRVKPTGIQRHGPNK